MSLRVLEVEVEMKTKVKKKEIQILAPDQVLKILDQDLKKDQDLDQKTKTIQVQDLTMKMKTMTMKNLLGQRMMTVRKRSFLNMGNLHRVHGMIFPADRHLP